MFSIIIPTMWRSTLIKEMLPKYEACKLVGEIILIDNDISLTPEFRGFKKLIYLPKKENIFVNPAWNLGSSLAKYRIIFANDDILIDNLLGLLTKLKSTHFDVVGAQIYSDNKSIRKLDKFPAQSWGSFLCFKDKYHYVPEQFKVYMGDKLFFDSFNCAWIGGYIKSPRSQTVKSINVSEYIEREGLMYAKMKVPCRENIIIRTSNRPNYFQNAIKSVKKHAPNAKIHVTIDDIKDLDYVLKYAPDCNYYLVDREKMLNFGRKVEIQTKSFCPNLYLNVVKPFLNGWCTILDDDCCLVSDLVIPENENEIVLSKVDIRSRIVPVVWKNEPTFTDIDMGGIIFHSSRMVDFTPQRGGDYKFIAEMYSKSDIIWNDNIVVQMQTGLNHGNRKDLC